MTTTFAVSYVLLWLVTLLLGTALFILYSHVGRTLLDSREGLAFQGPPIGNRLAPRVLTTLSGGTYTLATPASRWRLVLFVSPKCKPCRAVLESLPEFVRRYGDRVETVLICRGEERDAIRFTSGLPATVMVCADPRSELIEAYKVLVTPFALSLDTEGVLYHNGVPGTDVQALTVFVARLLRESHYESAVGGDKPSVVRTDSIAVEALASTSEA